MSDMGSGYDTSSAAAIPVPDAETSAPRSRSLDLVQTARFLADFVSTLQRLTGAFASFRRSEPPLHKEIQDLGVSIATATLPSKLQSLLNATLQEVLLHPAQEQPRETHAAILRSAGDLRGEFILAQLRYARARDGGALATAYGEWREAERLLSVHGHSWDAEVRSMVEDYVFHRGFVELVKMPAAHFLENAKTLFSQAPILHLDLTDVSDVASELFRSVHLTRIRSLALDDCALGAREVHLLAKSDRLGELRWLSLAQNCIDREGVEALASRWKSMPNLRYINFFGNLVDPTEKQAHDGGDIVDTWLPDEVQELERAYDSPPWLRLPRDADRRIIQPDRFTLASPMFVPFIQAPTPAPAVAVTVG